jgi:tetratricopeptide (TPR) repeat protein
MNFTLTRPNLIKLLVPLFAFAATFLAVKLIDSPSGSSPAGAGAGAPGGFADARTTDARIRSLQAAVKKDTSRAAPYAALGDAYLQKARETGDAALYARAESALRSALERDPRDAGALTAMGSLANSRHDFSAALRYGERARAQAPGVVKPYGVIVDAQVELGRYEAAERTLQRMVDLKPNLASYARVSYFRELHGDLPGAVEAMRLAASAGGATAENVAYVQTLLGNLELARGRVPAAERAYRLALSRYPGYVPARAGLANVVADRGDLVEAARRYRALVAGGAGADHVLALAEVELVLGRRAAARRHIALVDSAHRGELRAGGEVDAGMVVIEADHLDRRRAVALGRRAWAVAPSVSSADALGWALTRAGRPAAGLRHARHALRLGSRNASFLYHAGIAARGAGEPAAARRYLRAALEARTLSPLHERRAQAALASLRAEM